MSAEERYNRRVARSTEVAVGVAAAVGLLLLTVGRLLLPLWGTLVLMGVEVVITYAVIVARVSKGPGQS